MRVYRNLIISVSVSVRSLCMVHVLFSWLFTCFYPAIIFIILDSMSLYFLVGSHLFIYLFIFCYFLCLLETVPYDELFEEHLGSFEIDSQLHESYLSPREKKIENNHLKKAYSTFAMRYSNNTVVALHCFPGTSFGNEHFPFLQGRGEAGTLTCLLCFINEIFCQLIYFQFYRTPLFRNP